ncbi:uncharacterized protein LOC114481503 [Gouania willdenowi]|uniref:Uncharacterized LOC114481503 n=1 Tax=Gouania willdenowi TaxID=441366 RepID=A0A8C5H191_GOUWI|nr:uncharacterized protein LOC114481503 [Gouania willdenowi]
MEAAQLTFDGSKDKYDLWESRFLGHLHTLKLKETILYEPANDEQRAQDSHKKADCYAELIRLIDYNSFLLIKHEAAGDGRKALKMLREHYSKKSIPAIVNLYTSLIKLKMTEYEGVTEFLSRAENVIAALRDAGETPSDGVMIAMVLNGLPDSFKPISVQVSNSQDNITFTEFKRRLRDFERTEKTTKDESIDNFVNTCMVEAEKTIWTQTAQDRRKMGMKEAEKITPTMPSDDLIMTCVEETVNKIKTEPTDSLIMTCVEEAVPKIKTEPPEEDMIVTCVDEIETNLKVESPDHFIQPCMEQRQRETAEGKCSSNIIKDAKKFVSLNTKFHPANRFVKVPVSDGSRSNLGSQQKMPAVIYLLDNAGQQHRAELRETFYIPTRPQTAVPVAKAATGAVPIPIPKKAVPIQKKASPIIDCDADRPHQNKGPYVKKPLNAFMLFLKEHRKSVEAEVGIKTSACINKVLGQRWKTLPDKEKETFFARATMNSHIHAKHHPGWTPKENYGKRKKRVRKRDLAEASSATEVRQPNPPKAAVQSSTAHSHMSILPKLPTYDNPILLMGPCYKQL